MQFKLQYKSLFRTKPIQQFVKDAAHDPSIHGLISHELKRTLGVWDLTAFGIAAIVGAGIFSTIGNASFNGGPAVVFLFIFTAIACAFSAFCYAEFSSAMPISGSAYSYAYASLGELVAWIIGWDLLMEYAIGNIAVAISWSDYFTSFCEGYGIHFPKYLTMDYVSASRAFQAVQTLGAQAASAAQMEGFDAWTQAPRVLGIPFICDVPAMFVVVLVTWIVYIGIQESKRVANAMVAIKLAVIGLVIALGAFYVKPSNWSPFAPNGASGVLKGVSAVFFAYIGFDAISTTAEECKNPQRDLPKAMVYSLIICTILYAAVALVLTGIVNYKDLEVGDPLAYVFGPHGANIHWVSGVISISAVIAMFTVLLVFQLGQPRIWMAMSRDGLLPKIFSAIHPKYKTPWFSTILTGFVVAIPCLFMNLTEVTDLTSIGTLFAFIVVCGGVLRMDPHRPKIKGQFRTPYINSQYIFPALTVLGLASMVIFEKPTVIDFFTKFTEHQFPLAVFLVELVFLVYYSFTKKLSLIPLLGLTTCSYLMTELGIVNWTRFGIWLVLGLAIYFMYSVKYSKLNPQRSHRKQEA